MGGSKREAVWKSSYLLYLTRWYPASREYPPHIVIAYPLLILYLLLPISWGEGKSTFTMPRLNLNLKFLGEILVSSTGGGQSSFTMSRLNLILKILGEILVSNTGVGVPPIIWVIIGAGSFCLRDKDPNCCFSI